jgi:hypothetical protein
MLIKRVYEVDPLECPACGGKMKIISFIERGQSDVIERILRHCELWEGPIRTLASARAPPPTRHPADPCAGCPPRRAADPARDLELVPDAEFLESQRLEGRLENQPTQPRELQLVLDPEYL